MSRITAVIPAINESTSIAQAVRSALAAGVAEVIVVDAGSDDPTSTLASQAGARVIPSTPGRAVQQNTGAAQAVGDVLLFLHADNWLGPAVGSQISGCLQCAKVVSGALWQRIEAQGFKYRLLEHGNAARAKCFGAVYGDQAIFVRRETFEAVGGFPDAAMMEDLLLMRRLRRLGKPALLPGPVYVSPRRWEKNGVFRQTLRNWSLVGAHWLGASPEQLVRFYPRNRDEPQSPNDAA